MSWSPVEVVEPIPIPPLSNIIHRKNFPASLIFTAHFSITKAKEDNLKCDSGSSSNSGRSKCRGRVFQVCQSILMNPSNHFTPLKPVTWGSEMGSKFIFHFPLIPGHSLDSRIRTQEFCCVVGPSASIWIHRNVLLQLLFVSSGFFFSFFFFILRM